MLPFPNLVHYFLIISLASVRLVIIIASLLAFLVYFARLCNVSSCQTTSCGTCCTTATDSVCSSRGSESCDPLAIRCPRTLTSSMVSMDLGDDQSRVGFIFVFLTILMICLPEAHRKRGADSHGFLFQYCCLFPLSWCVNGVWREGVDPST